MIVSIYEIPSPVAYPSTHLFLSLSTAPSLAQAKAYSLTIFRLVCSIPWMIGHLFDLLTNRADGDRGPVWAIFEKTDDELQRVIYDERWVKKKRRDGMRRTAVEVACYLLILSTYLLTIILGFFLFFSPFPGLFRHEGSWGGRRLRPHPFT